MFYLANLPIVVSRDSECPVADSKDTVGPLMGNRVKLPVQLTHGDGLRVNHRPLYRILIH